MRKLLSLFIAVMPMVAAAQEYTVDMNNTETFIIKDNGNDQIEEVRTCLEYRDDKVCNFQEACTVTCIGSLALAGYYWVGPITVTAAAIGSNYCGNLCRKIEDCHNIPTCVRWSF